MAKVYVFLADGFEEVEAVTPIDILRRAGDDVTTVSITGSGSVRGSHGISVEADVLFEDVSLADGDVYVLPGGGEGTSNLMKCVPLKELLKEKCGEGRRIAAICAAPTVLADAGLLEGRTATAYPGRETDMRGAKYVVASAVTDGNVTTGHGAGAAVEFALELVRVLHGEEKSEDLRKVFVFRHHVDRIVVQEE